MEEGSVRVMGIPSLKTGPQVEGRTSSKVTRLKLTPPTDRANCTISDNMVDCCKTRCKVCTTHFVVNLRLKCKVCGKAYSLTRMRQHTMGAHKLQITEYKAKYGPFQLVQVVLYL